MSDARVMLFDIEASDLQASFGHTLCFGYKYEGAEMASVIALTDVPKPKRGEEPDAPLMRRVHDLLTNHADIVVTYYGKGFDRKFLNTRMLLAGLPPLPPLNAEHVDLYWTAKANLALHSNRLQAVAETLGCPIDKTPVRADVWRRAVRGDREAMAYVVEHCRRDVEVLEWVYLKLRGFVRQHPPRSINALACRACGRTRLRSNGLRFVRGEQQRRLQCQGCGAWTYEKANGRRVG